MKLCSLWIRLLLHENKRDEQSGRPPLGGDFQHEVISLTVQHICQDFKRLLGKEGLSSVLIYEAVALRSSGDGPALRQMPCQLCPLLGKETIAERNREVLWLSGADTNVGKRHPSVKPRVTPADGQRGGSQLLPHVRILEQAALDAR